MSTPQGPSRHPSMSESDINYILLNGAHISLSELRRAKTFENSLFFLAQIGVYLEVSLSRGAGISDETREVLERLHREGTELHMQLNKSKHTAQNA
ncbi:MAG: excinuclease ABC subunit C [Pontibacterium sp.]